MNWISRSLPPEADDPPAPAPVEVPAPAVAIDPIEAEIEAERAELREKVRPRVCTARQVRIRGRITALTIESLKRRSDMAKHTAAELRTAIDVVEAKLAALPPFPTGNGATFDHRNEWWRTVSDALTSLGDAGATVSSPGGNDRRMRFAGVTAASTCGAQYVMHNWLRAARKRLETMEA